MRKWWIAGGALVIVAWFGLKDAAYRGFLATNIPASPEMLDYSMQDSWVIFPEAAPPGAWETPWGVDAFIVAPPAGLATASGLSDARSDLHQAAFQKSVEELLRAIPDTVTAYAPHYHSPSAANTKQEPYKVEIEAQLLAAFRHYMDTHNQGRAILVLYDDRADAFMGPILDTLRSDNLFERYAGSVSIIASGKYDEADMTYHDRCSPALDDGCLNFIEATSISHPLGFLAPRLPGRVVERAIIDSEGASVAIAAQAKQVSVWLDETAPKPAEPLGDFEEVDVVPIYRPGDSEPVNQ